MREPAGNRPRTARGSAAVEVALIVPMLIVLVLALAGAWRWVKRTAERAAV